MSLLRPSLRPTLSALSTLTSPLPSTIRSYAKKLRPLPEWLQVRKDRKSSEFIALQAEDPTIPPYRQLRATFDDESITVYQAYPPEIAIPAVENQRLNSVKEFKVHRGAFIKPSFCWMLWRTNYTADPAQSHILALRLSRKYFDSLLEPSQLHLNQAYITNRASKGHHYPTLAQWDPERNIHAEKMMHRTLVLRIPVLGVKRHWLAEGNILEIRDESARAKQIRDLLSEGKNEEAEGLRPKEGVYPVSEEIYEALGMGYTSG